VTHNSISPFDVEVGKTIHECSRLSPPSIPSLEYIFPGGTTQQPLFRFAGGSAGGRSWVKSFPERVPLKRPSGSMMRRRESILEHAPVSGSMGKPFGRGESMKIRFLEGLG
jgi:hypothetical protein